MRSKFINADSKLRSKRIATEDSETNFCGGGKEQEGSGKSSWRMKEIRSGLEGWVARFGRPKWSKNGGLGRAVECHGYLLSWAPRSIQPMFW